MKKFSVIYIQKNPHLYIITLLMMLFVLSFAFVVAVRGSPQTAKVPKPLAYSTIYIHLRQHQIRLEFSHAQNYDLKPWPSDRLINFYSFSFTLVSHNHCFWTEKTHSQSMISTGKEKVHSWLVKFLEKWQAFLLNHGRA